MLLFSASAYADGFTVTRGFTVRRASVDVAPLPDRVYLFTNEKNCAPCVRIKKETFPELKKRGILIGVENGNDVQVIDQTANPEWVKAYGISTVPTWVFIKRNVVARKREGFLTADEFQAWLREK